MTRTTTDGNFTLTKNIFFKYGSRLVLIGNLLKNNDTVSHPVIFTRYADLDIDASSGSDVFDTVGASVVAEETNGVALTSLGNPGLVGSFGAETFNNWGPPPVQPASPPSLPGPPPLATTWRTWCTRRPSLQVRR